MTKFMFRVLRGLTAPKLCLNQSMNEETIREWFEIKGWFVGRIARELGEAPEIVRAFVKEKNMVPPEKTYHQVMNARFVGKTRKNNAALRVKDRISIDKLFGHCPDVRFWEVVDVSAYDEIYSPAFLLCDNILEKIKKQYRAWSYTPPTTPRTPHPASLPKIGEDYVFENKEPKCAAEFMAQPVPQ